MGVLGTPLLWRGWFRLALFWGSFAATLIAMARFAPHSDWNHVLDVLREVSNGDIEHVSERSFAFALSSGIGQIAIALAGAFLISHVLLLRATLRGARGFLGRPGDFAGFALAFDGISGRLECNAVVGHGWRQFSATVIRDDNVVRYTVRPQTYINLADARGELFGLKMMSSIPGYFVGLGLLLTFIGLVLALNRAAGSTAAGSAEAMTTSLNELLAAATFKFSTSIAGLGASLGLALTFRTYQIWIEGAFEGLSRAIEQRMIFSPPQRIAEESRQILAAQRDQLKEINSERFFARLGESVAPALGSAITKAVAPLSDRLERTTEELARTSRTGADSLVQNFVERLDQGASREMREIVDTLKSLRDSLDKTQHNLSGSGQDFSSKLTQAAEAIGKVLATASENLSGSAADVAKSVQAGLAQVMESLEAQSKGFGGTLTDLQKRLADQLEESTRRSVTAGEQAAAAVHAGIDEVVGVLRSDIAALSDTLRSVSLALSGQTAQIETISDRSRETADAFSQVASDVRSASEPLLMHSARVAESTERMSTSMAESVEALSSTQESADNVAEKLSAHLAQIAQVWDQYETRFKSVDEDLGRAADRFHEEVSRHQESMRDFVKQIDDHTGAILGKISSAVVSLSENVETLHETLDGFLQAMITREPAE
ncbi:anti-phage ZorAB system protein ZorA [Bradyrhizobium sp. ISRA464]|uniref:anti-phage ZorAB system protein ZorA n=1 Tax=Bradyrhizobium sp. ISRA464 TaxID=2866200 RepID=UPI00247890C0|nr:anti-phage ZorAB system protein ZorA [Bradyrhizobium sp. ISRA464]WGS25797.1 anti-phage defense ZorAB system protein ZorA [Bradyrhizobium sp. ISRA464]